jgi:putative protease
VVTHYYPQANACALRIEEGTLRTGDTVHIRGHTTDFYQRVDRLEWEHEVLESAGTGQSVAMQVSQRVREGDEVFRLNAPGS